MNSEEPMTEEQQKLAMIVLKSQLTANAFLNWTTLDPRTLTVLLKNEVPVETEEFAVNQRVVEIVADVDHADRVTTPLGPSVFCNMGDEKKVSTVTDILFSPDVRTRAVALSHFRRLASHGDELLTERTRAVIADRSTDLLSTDCGLWRSAAVAIADAVGDDFLCGVAQLRQCHELRWEDGIARALTAVLRPQTHELISLQPVVWNATHEHEKIESVVSECASMPLTQACKHYFSALGHLPLGRTASMADMVQAWIDCNNSRRAIWSRIWAWADSTNSPLARYHACTVFVRYANLVPRGGEVQLWREIASVVHVSGRDGRRLRWTRAWELRCDLAKMYTSRLECLTPNSDSERLAGFAWWLAEKVASVFGEDENAIDYLWKRVIEPDSTSSLFTRQLVQPPVSPSTLRYGTLFVGSLWSLSLLCQLNDRRAPQRCSSSEQDTRDVIGKALLSNLMLCFPMNSEDKQSLTYAFGEGLVASARAWADAWEDLDTQDGIGGWLQIHSTITDPCQSADAVRRIMNEYEGGRYLLARNMRTMACTDLAPLDVVWECVADESWRNEVFGKLEPAALELLHTAFAEIQSRNEPKWRANIPHYFSMACEAAADDPERRELLFALTLISCGNTDTVGALERLLRGQKKHLFHDEVKNWRERLESIRPDAPGWVSGRIRSLLASLYLSE